MTPKEIRLSSGLSIERAAVYAGVTSPTLRLYEISQTAPRPDKRSRLDRFYAGLAERLASAASSPPSAA